MAKESGERKVSVPGVEMTDGAVGVFQRVEARLEMVFGQLQEVRRENAELKDWMKRMVRKVRGA